MFEDDPMENFTSLRRRASSAELMYRQEVAKTRHLIAGLQKTTEDLVKTNGELNRLRRFRNIVKAAYPSAAARFWLMAGGEAGGDMPSAGQGGSDRSPP
ncbi:hypothetical protein D2T29_05085 [Sinirhodobacter populi]|uniref:Uncharacterized protein n=1 Tax=Paenirhodobacter populi TaxID=2306993 RepID=A0A443KNA3_9RHOB|nr:hypothetical protein [Sinirhodobacter populi]RWR34269.1 hypothetical protein D2T29_05085 [Sinirhodobacter populi]